MIPPEFTRFFDEIRADGVVPPNMVDDLEEATRATVEEAGADTRAIDFVDGLSWIFKQRSRSIPEKLQAVCKLAKLQGKVRVLDLRKFLGW